MSSPSFDERFEKIALDVRFADMLAPEVPCKFCAKKEFMLHIVLPQHGCVSVILYSQIVLRMLVFVFVRALSSARAGMRAICSYALSGKCRLSA